MIISLIAALDLDNNIGNQNQLPWHLPADLRHFKEQTLNKPILMGRKTYESIGRPLPQRSNLVLTRQKGFTLPGVEVVRTVKEAIDFAQKADHEELMVIGGSQIYQLCLPLAQKLYLTRIQHRFEGDATFPEFDTSEWALVSEEPHSADEKNPYSYCFEIYQRQENTGYSNPTA